MEEEVVEEEEIPVAVPLQGHHAPQKASTGVTVITGYLGSGKTTV